MTAGTFDAIQRAHRPARRFGLLGGIVAMLLVLAPVAATPVAAAGSPATATALSSDAAATLTVSPASATLGPDQDLTVTVTIDNPGESAMPAGSVEVAMGSSALKTREQLDSWFDSADASLPSGPSTTVPTPAINPAGSAVVIATIAAADLPLAGSPWGVRGIAARFSAGEGDPIGARTVITWSSGADTIAPASFAVAIPLTAPVGDTGLLSSADLTSLTEPGGLLDRELTGVTGRPITIGIDPMIIASIRALGTSAPTVATDWLTRLQDAPNDTFPLQWADADVSAQAQAGLGSLLQPTSLSYALNPDDFVNATPTPLATTTPDPDSTSGSTAPSDDPPTDGAVESVPTLAELTAWNYRLNGIAWPASGTVAAGNPEFFATNGLPTTIVSSDDLASAPTTTPRIGAKSGSASIALADGRLSSALSSALAAGDDSSWRAAMAEASAVLAIASKDGTGTVLAALERGWPASGQRIAQTMDALGSYAWATPAQLAIPGPSSSIDVTLSTDAETVTRTATVKELATDETALSAFATALTDPTVLTGAERSQLLGLLSVAWRSAPDAWMAATTQHRAATATTLASVSLVPSSDVLVIGSPAEIPLSVRNDFSSGVNVSVTSVPSNGRLVVDHDVKATIAAGSSATVKIPVSAQVSSGEVVLAVTLHSPTGVQLGDVTYVTVNVQADWEGFGAIVVAILLIAFFGIGIWRSVRRRRRERTTDDTAAVSDDGVAAESTGATEGDAGGTPEAADTDNETEEIDETDEGNTDDRG